MAHVNKEKTDLAVEPIQCVWGLLCSMSVTDKDSNSISIFNIVEQFNLVGDAFRQQEKEKKTLIFPAQYEIILFLRRTLDIGISNEQIFTDLKIKTFDPNGSMIQETVSSLTFPKNMKRMRYRVVMAGLSFTAPGNYIHQIEMKFPASADFKKLLEIPFEILEKNIT